MFSGLDGVGRDSVLHFKEGLKRLFYATLNLFGYTGRKVFYDSKQACEGFPGKAFDFN